MPITPIHAIIIIGVTGLITFGSRLLPFLFFRKGNVPQPILYLGNVLPAAMMALLIVYSLKDTNVISYPYGLPELMAIVFAIGLHCFKRNSLISIFGSTIVYMILVQMM